MVPLIVNLNGGWSPCDPGWWVVSEYGRRGINDGDEFWSIFEFVWSPGELIEAGTLVLRLLCSFVVGVITRGSEECTPVVYALLSTVICEYEKKIYTGTNIYKNRQTYRKSTYEYIVL